MGCKMTVIVALCGADEGFKVANCIVFEISLVLCLPKSTLSRSGGGSGSGSGSGTLNTTVMFSSQVSKVFDKKEKAAAKY